MYGDEGGNIIWPTVIESVWLVLHIYCLAEDLDYLMGATNGKKGGGGTCANKDRLKAKEITCDIFNVTKLALYTAGVEEVLT